MAGKRAGQEDAPPGLQRRLTVPLFAVSSVTGSGVALLHAFLAALRPSSPNLLPPSVGHPLCLYLACALEA
jgi:GTPase